MLLLVKGQKKPSSTSHHDSGMALINFASKRIKIPSIISWFHCLEVSSIKVATFASANVSTLGKRTSGGCFLGNQWCCHILIALPFPILQRQPLSKTSLPCKILFQACEPPLVCLASIIVQFGKKRALKTL